ncbi:MAG: helix-turn-helix transcriptional regulator [Acholeplasmatales bacterium]|nr:helix-turn-helix transcriptional regulator [Acholeplasmatales bacterium]
MSDLKQTIGKNLTELRKRKKYTQQDLGNVLQYSDKAISKWEKGDSLPDIETLYQICNLYGVTLDYLTHEGAYEDKKEFLIPQYEMRNKIIITALFGSLSWFIAILIYVYMIIYKNQNVWPIIIWGIPVSCVVAWYFNLKWGRRIWNLPVLTIFVWTFIAAIYLHMLYFGNNFWPLFLLGIPLQIALILWSQLRHE